MKNFVTLLCLCFAVATFSGNAGATVLFTDNFNAENGGTGVLNYYGLSQWNVTSGSVDLIGNSHGSNFYDFYPGNGLYLDMDGSTYHAGTIQTKTSFNFLPGTYTLTFDLGGNHLGAPTDSMLLTVGLGSLFSKNYSLASGAPYALVTETFTVNTAATGSLIFNHAGVDNMGMILDNVTLSYAPVPEPGTMMLLGIGMLGMAVYGKRRMNKEA